MENPQPANTASLKKKDVQRVFKETFKANDPENTKMMDKEKAAKTISECMNKLNIAYSEEQAIKLLEEFDLDKSGSNNKKEIKKVLLIAVGLEELSQEYIAKMKKKWAKKQKKKVDSTPENKAKRKELKGVFKTHFKTTFNQISGPNSKTVSMEQAKEIVKEVVTKAPTEINMDDLDEVLKSVNMEGGDQVHKKSVGLAIKHYFGMKEIDHEEMKMKHQRWQMKQKKREEKKKT